MKLRLFFQRNREAVLFCIKFLVFLVVFQMLVTDTLLGSWLNLWKPFAEWSARISAFVLSVLGWETKTYGSVLVYKTLSVNVSKGCDGLTASAIFVAAVLAFRASWRAKLLGSALGFLAIQIVNVLRIMILFLTLVYFPKLFENMHVFIMQSLVIAFSIILWFYWAQKYAKASPR